ncbi:hypothetical protein OXYTRIMIC_033 [Oxytricha trifallax]|uniref:Uncharacterized protein n=1 Tax=Oxytricha trifallax TaxID=1172189 RepID=A0A073HY94_9SPIT|nr:hypothetical protein OXYTRIMIC_033 [Oxytricha trifallax]
MKRVHDREQARLRGNREWDLWSLRQENHWREINEEWQHDDMIPGKHIQEHTMEICSRHVEDAQFSKQKTSQMILPPIVLNDKGIVQVEKAIGSTNWKLENGKFWREEEDIKSAIIPVCCQSKSKAARIGQS